MMDVKFVACYEGDWCAVYIDGELYTQGHDVPAWEWLKILSKVGANAEEVYDRDRKFGEYLDEFGGRFPQSFSDVEKALNEL